MRLQFKNGPRGFPRPDSRVAVIGSTTLDEVWISGRHMVKMGGVTTYAGLTYARSGIPTRVVTRVSGSDTWMMKRLHTEGILPFYDKDDATTGFIHFVEGNTRRQEIRSRARPIPGDAVIPAAKGVDTIHLGPLHPMDIDPRVIGNLNRDLFFIVLDLQGYLRRIEETRVRPGVSPALADVLRVARIIKGDREEMALTLDFFGLKMEGLLSKFQIEEAVVTEGYKGGWVQRYGGETHYFKGEPIPNPWDPTGAGDVFFATYVIQRRFKGLDIPGAAAAAAETAARQVAGDHIPSEILSPG